MASFFVFRLGPPTPLDMAEYAQGPRPACSASSPVAGDGPPAGPVALADAAAVIGVPVALKYLDGLDSLLSIVQIPAGVPVATLSTSGANAGLSRGTGSWPRTTRLAVRGPPSTDLAEVLEARTTALARQIA